MTITDEHHRLLLKLARDSIAHGIATGEQMKIKSADYPPELREYRATFVTLELKGRLRGCVGMLEAIQPLVVDVVHSAYFAAFRDNRFPPLKEEELEALEIHISILTPLQKIEFASQEDLLSKLRPGIDGLVLCEGPMRGAFLPVMWEELGTPQNFLEHLKNKAGLPMGYWSDTIEAFRFEAERIPA